MYSVTVVDTGSEQWDGLLAGITHDVYHTKGYHALAEWMNEGSARLFIYAENARRFAFPFLLRSLPEHVSRFADEFRDVSSVYGYPGPIATGDADSGFLERAHGHLNRYWESERVICSFTRFNPILGNHAISSWHGANGFLSRPGRTVSFDLTMSRENQTSLYTKTLRQEISGARKKGLSTCEDSDWSHADEFFDLYNASMLQRGAPASYLLPPHWVYFARQYLGNHVRLLHARIDGQIAASICVLEREGVVHAHLTGINQRFAALSPLKLLLDEVSHWARTRGNRTFHLGGGVGGREDSLFEFKRRFSPRFHDFAIGGFVVDHKEYSRITRLALGCETLAPAGVGFFPPYLDPRVTEQLQTTQAVS